MNVFVTSLLKIINNPDIQDTNYNIAYYLLLHYYDVFEMTLQEIEMHVMFLFLLSIAFLEYLDLKNFQLLKI